VKKAFTESRSRCLLVILVLAFALRLAGGQVVERQIRAAHGPTARFLFPDSYQFHVCARNLLERGEYVDDQGRRAWRTPVYSLLLAGLYRVVGDDPRGARTLGNLLDVLNVLMIFFLARAFFGERPALFAAGMAAVYPFFIYFSNLVLADTLGVGAVLLCTLAFAKVIGVGERLPEADPVALEQQPPSRRAAAIASVFAGFALAFAILVKAAFALLGLFFLGFLCVRAAAAAGRNAANVRAGQRLLPVLPLLAIAFVLGMAPWWIRNHRIFERAVPFSTMGGFTLYESNSDHADGGPNHGKTTFPWIYTRTLELMRTGQVDAHMNREILDDLQRLGDFDGIGTDEEAWLAGVLRKRTTVSADRDAQGRPASGVRHETRLNGNAAFGELFADRLLARKAEAWIAKNPRAFLRLAVAKVGRTWSPWPNWSGAQAWYYRVLVFGSYVPVMLLAVVGLWTERRRWREIGLLLVPALYILCLHSVFMGSIRYRLPAMACLIVIAAAGLERIVARARDERS